MKMTHVDYLKKATAQDIYENIACIAAPIFAFILLLTILIGLLGTTGYVETHYDTVAEVLSNDGDSVLLVDGAGYVWEMTNRPDLTKGQFVKIKFFNNTTDYTREDDEIVKITLLDD